MLFSPSDEKLIARALNGSQRGWVVLVRRYERQVYNHCLRMSGDRGDALDLTQEVFLAVYRHLPSYRGQGAFPAWLLRIAANKSLDFLRQRRRSPRRAGGDEEATLALVESSWASPPALHEQQRGNSAVLAALAELPPEQRLVVELKFFNHCTLEDIAAQTGVSLNTAKSRFYTALQKLKQHLEERHEAL